MTDPTLTSTPRRPAIPPRRAAAWLALVAAVLAVPLAGDLAGVAQDPRRDLAALGGGTVWAGVVLALVVGLALAALVRPASWLPGTAIGVALALLVGAAAVATDFLRAPGYTLPDCRLTPTAAGQFQVQARTSDDGVVRGSLALGVQAVSRDGRQLLSALIADLQAAAVEDMGVERLTGGTASDPLYARHCRALVSGSQVTAALPLLTNGAGAGSPPLVPPDLPVWRGDFDWWVSAEGTLVGATFRVGGHPADAWESHGLQGLLTAELWPVEFGVQL